MRHGGDRCGGVQGDTRGEGNALVRCLAGLEGRDTERSGEHWGAQVTLLTGGREASLTCTRVRMTSMGLVRTEAVAAARGPETA